MISQRSKTNNISKTSDPTKHLSKSAALEIVVPKKLWNSKYVSVVKFTFSKAREVFNFTKDIVRLVVPTGTWKIFKRDISCTPTASYFHYYVMPQHFLLHARVFNLYLFRWQHWKITSERLFNNIFSGSSAISNFSCKHKLHRLELGL